MNSLPCAKENDEIHFIKHAHSLKFSVLLLILLDLLSSLMYRSLTICLITGDSTRECTHTLNLIRIDFISAIYLDTLHPIHRVDVMLDLFVFFFYLCGFRKTSYHMIFSAGSSQLLHISE